MILKKGFFNNIYNYRISHKGAEKWIDLNEAAEKLSSKTGSLDTEKAKNAAKAYLEEWLDDSAGNLKKKSQIQPTIVSRSIIQPTHSFNAK